MREGAGRSVPEAETPAEPDLGALYGRYGEGLYAYACLLCRSRAEAEDAVQETFVRVAKSPDRFRGAADERGYLFAMLRNEAMRLRGKMRLWREGDLGAGALRFEAVGSGAGEGGAEAREEAERLSRALASLPDEQREAVYLKVWGEMTFGAIAALLSIPPDTAASRYRYGIGKLRKAMEGSDRG